MSYHRHVTMDRDFGHRQKKGTGGGDELNEYRVVNLERDFSSV